MLDYIIVDNSSNHLQYNRYRYQNSLRPCLCDEFQSLHSIHLKTALLAHLDPIVQVHVLDHRGEIARVGGVARLGLLRRGH